MKTRSQTIKHELDVNIDFDEASQYWNANKKRTGNGCYKYVCGKQLKNDNFCKRNLKKGKEYCIIHAIDE